ncbi:nucleotide exchange factor GrpE [Candidatus Falkowbacteria bacterium HGW-Falkowbacteria-1]|jgi:molecular chaperone GrpE|uniref:Protein GrpE n=1 Tax=Candidatus Falkowbacteria bacterium HGW-Falkowbacteria-1 TaxID=2013768 RepID=A0A2N2EAM6_9BACT|nr:MAG: nucleotide exchange factor GrpE [Candidatus Falkowbacteria bacterium HGW-Falkowbacteria-1]
MNNDFKDDLRGDSSDDNQNSFQDKLQDENINDSDNNLSNNKTAKNGEVSESEANENDDDSVVNMLKEENKILENKYKRALADYQNLLKNSAEEKLELLKYSLEGFLLEILPIYSNLNASISNLSDEQANNPWVEGVKYIIKQFDEFFSKNDVSKIKTFGEKFDYNTMEAVDGQGDYVVKELRPGYKLKNKTIIAAGVVVGDRIEDKSN